MLMNAALKHSARAGLRFQSTTTTIYANKKATLTVRKAWLQDPSTYPLIGIMATAGCLVVGVISSCLLYSPDVQISPSKRGAIMRHWSF